MSTSFLTVIDILGTFSFAVSGAFLAMEKKLDPFGVGVVALVTATGGGTLRDIMIGNLPVNWLTNNTAVLVILSAAVSTMLFGGLLKKFTKTLFIFDALGLGLFTLVGLKIGLEKGFTTGICVALGTITACFGGVVRDVLLNTIPLLFRKEIYALACITGGLAYLLLRQAGFADDINTVLCIGIIFCTRLLAVQYRISLPLFYQKNKSI